MIYKLIAWAPTLLLIVVVLLLSPESANAQLVQCTGLNCNFCDVVDLFNRIIIWLVGVLTAVAAVLFAIAGFRLVTSGGDQSAATKAKDTLKNVIIGFVIILAAWLIVDTILEVLTDKGGLDEWGLVSCGGLVEPVETAVDEIPTGIPGASFEAGMGAGGLSDSEARELMERAGISAKEGVSYEGLQPHVIAGAADLARDCDCDPLVTAATDGQHAAGDYSHGNGYKLDFRTRDNPDLVQYVRSLPSAGAWSDGTQLYKDDTRCATYAVEGNHVDGVYKPNCSAL